MTQNRGFALSKRMDRCESSPLRDIFKAIKSESIISFAGGLPAAETFSLLPLDRKFVNHAAPALYNSANIRSHLEPLSRERLIEPNKPFDESMLAKDSLSQICQYGDSSGEFWLREWVQDYLAGIGLQVNVQQIIIVTGSQQGLDLAAKLLVDTATPVAIESPTYLAALQCFSLFGAHFIPLSPVTSALSGDLITPQPNVDVCYLNPTFQNPTGKVYSRLERQAAAEYCQVNQAVLIEDDPYRELYYDDCCRTPICSLLNHEASWIYQSSFSKTVAPGFRVGFLAASSDLIPHLVKLKQAADLHTSRLAQQALRPCLENSFNERTHYLRNFYRTRRDSFHALLLDNFSELAEWEIPSGGMFFWLKLRCRLSLTLTELLELALVEGVAFMPGEHFYSSCSDVGVSTETGANDSTCNATMRLNFTSVAPDSVGKGLSTLAELIRKHSVSA